MENLNWYNTQVRLRISDRYVSIGVQVDEYHKQMVYLQKRLSEEDISHKDYMKLAKDLARTEDIIASLEEQRKVWAEAREICLEVADEMNNGGAK